MHNKNFNNNNKGYNIVAILSSEKILHIKTNKIKKNEWIALWKNNSTSALFV